MEIIRTPQHKWTEEQIDFIERNIKGTPYKTMRKMANDQFNLDLSLNQVSGFIKRNDLTNGLDCTFRKGQKSWNKGMKGLDLAGENGRKTQFKKGQKPINYRPIGSERVCPKDGYIIVKVSDEGKFQDRWRHKHVIEWEKVHGKTPLKHVVTFLDNDKNNTDISNLALLPRSELVRMNQGNHFSNNPEETLVGITLVRLNTKIFEAEYMNNDKDAFQKYAEQAEQNGIERETFKARLRRGWGIRDAVSKPLNYRGAKHA